MLTYVEKYANEIRDAEINKRRIYHDALIIFTVVFNFKLITGSTSRTIMLLKTICVIRSVAKFSSRLANARIISML